MNFPDAPDAAHVFGVPLTLTSAEMSQLRATISTLWQLTYGEAPREMGPDLLRCRDFFDPAVRGFKLRERIGSLPQIPPGTYQPALKLPGQIVTDAGDGRLIAGIEARLLLGLLDEAYQRQPGGHWVLSAAAARAAENQALAVYRSWSVRKLGEAIALKEGHGREVLQATSVGIVLALLVNRADSPDRAVMRVKELPDERNKHPIDDALHSAAAAFADSITTSRTSSADAQPLGVTASSRRNADSQRLHGGYPLTEARRRLAGKILDNDGAVYIARDAAGDVIRFFGNDLARRRNLTADQLAGAFDQLVVTFRDNALKLASHNVIFESPSATRSLRSDLLAVFTAARANGE